MMDELVARFLPRFLESARARLARARAAAPERAALELHALAGEAALLGFHELSQAARAGEAQARRGEAGAALFDSLQRMLPGLDG